MSSPATVDPPDSIVGDDQGYQYWYAARKPAAGLLFGSPA